MTPSPSKADLLPWLRVPLGAEIKYRAGGKYPEWERGQYFFAGLTVSYRYSREAVPNLWVADKWPITSPGNVTDEFDPNEWEPVQATLSAPDEKGVAEIRERADQERKWLCDEPETAALHAIKDRATLLRAYDALLARVAELEGSDLYRAGAREGWMRAYVYAVDIDAEDDERVIAEMDRRWPVGPTPEAARVTREQIARIVATHRNPITDEFWEQILQSSRRQRANHPELWKDNVEEALDAADAIMSLLHQQAAQDK